MLNSVEHEKSFMTSGPEVNLWPDALGFIIRDKQEPNLMQM